MSIEKSVHVYGRNHRIKIILISKGIHNNITFERYLGSSVKIENKLQYTKIRN